MQMETRIDGPQVQLTLSGSMYEREAAALKESLTRLIEDGKIFFDLDFSAVDYIDSAGLGALVTLQKRATQRGGGIVIRGLNGLVKELFMLTRVDKMFCIE